jgi:signal transduction histidine kinase/DNA-binding response OmpR family regulator
MPDDYPLPGYRLLSYLCRSMYYTWLIKCLLCCCALLHWGYTTAQQHYLFNTRRLTVKDGLAHMETYDLCQDTRGFIWIATRSGLSRYNGYTFTNYTKENNGLATNSIHNIMEDDKGTLWLLSRTDPNLYLRTKIQSIDLFNTITGTPLHFTEAFPQCPFKTEDIRHCFSTPDKALCFFAKSTLWVYTTANGFTPQPLPPGFFPLSRTVTGHWWGRQGSQYQKINADGEILARLTTDTLSYNEPAWFSETGVYIFYRNTNAATLFTIPGQSAGALPPALPFRNRAMIAPDVRRNLLWTAENNAVSCYDDNGRGIFTLNNDKTLIFERPIRKLFIDKQGLAWLATHAGLYLIEAKKERFTRYLYNDKINTGDHFHYECRGIHQYGQLLYVATYKGLAKINLQTGNTTLADKLTDNGKDLGIRFPLYPYQSGSYLVGTRSPVIVDAETGKETGFIRGVRGRSWCFYTDRDGRLLIGTEKGLLQYDKRYSDTVTLFQQYNEYKTLRESAIVQITNDRNNNTWLATSTGLYSLDADKGITGYYGATAEGKSNLLSNYIQHLYQDSSGIYWLATANAGLIRWNKVTGEQRQYSKLNGLSSNNLYAVYEDKRGFLWISSDYGLMRFNKAEEQVTLYTQEDGISHYEFNRLAHHKAADGRLYFGGLNGLIAFYPETFFDTTNTDANAIMVSGFQQYIGAKGNLIDLTNNLLTTNHIILNPGDRFFSISVAVPDYMNSRKTIYYYRIEGVDKDWTKTDNPDIRFGRLPYGDYTLRIKAQLPDGNFSGEKRISILAKRPWYLKWWFYVLAALLIAMLVRLFYQWRIRQLEQRKRELEKIVDTRTAELIADKKTIEQQASTLMQLDEMKSNFFVNVAHQLRTPLTLIAGPVKKLMQPENNSPQTYPYLKLAEQNIQELQQKINEILDFSKLEAGKLDIKKESVHLFNYLKVLIEPFQHTATLQQLQLLFHCQLTPHNTYMVDKGKLTDIVNNLLSNALKFTPSGGQVQLIVREASGVLLLIVKDTGIGIAPEEQEKVFKRYYQVKNEKHNRGGTGIGLAFTKELVLLLGGQITLHSFPGAGAEFRVSLPVTVTGVANDTPAPIPAEVSDSREMIVLPGSFPNTTILLVEDNIGLQQFISLELAQYRIIVAGNGAEAIRILENAGQQYPAINLIISDIMMPVMDGFAFLNHIKQVEAWKRIPVIMLTARTGSSDKLDALRIGVDDYMTKPFVTEELLARVNNLLQGYYQRTQEAATADLPDTATAAIARQPGWLQTIEQLVTQKLQEQILFTVDDIAEAMGLSTRQLQRNIKAETGLTPNTYIKEIRLHFARQLLEQKNFTTLAACSQAAGFNDPHYFSKLYQERFGIKPTDLLM